MIIIVVVEVLQGMLSWKSWKGMDFWASDDVKYSLVIVNFLFSIYVIILGWLCLVFVLLLFSNCKQNCFDIPEIEPETLSSIFALQYIKLDYAADQLQQPRQRIKQKHTIILYYYSMFLC